MSVCKQLVLSQKALNVNKSLTGETVWAAKVFVYGGQRMMVAAALLSLPPTSAQAPICDEHVQWAQEQMESHTY